MQALRMEAICLLSLSKQDNRTMERFVKPDKNSVMVWD